MADVQSTTDVLIDDAIEKVKSTLSRTIALKLVPSISLVLVPAAVWAQEKLGLNIDPTVVAVWAGSSLFAIAGVAISYVRARVQGVYKLHSELINQGLYAIEAGKTAIDSADEIPLPKSV